MLEMFPINISSSCVRFQLHVILKSLSSGKCTLKGFFSFKDFRPQNIPSDSVSPPMQMRAPL